VAAAFNGLAGAWAAASAWGLGPSYVCPSGGCTVPVLQSALPLFGVALVVDALVCSIGVRSAFAVGAVLSVAVAAVSALGWGGQVGAVPASVTAVSLVSAALDVLAVRRRSQLNEQANPMNLPVFG
jgi:hypothetical protein